MGCIKCTGLVTAELAGRLSSPVARAEATAEPSYGRKPGIDQIEREDSIRSSRRSSRRTSLSPSRSLQADGASDPDAEVDTSHALHPPVVLQAGGPISRLTEKVPPQQDDSTTAKEAPAYWGTEWAGKVAPDGTRVPQLAVCDFGYGASADRSLDGSDHRMAPAEPLFEPSLD